MSKYREGFVVEVDPETYRVRVDFPDRKVRSPWLSVLAGGSGEYRDARALSEGEFVAVMLDENETSGCVLGAVYSRANPPPELDGAERLVEFSDGALVTYDASTHTLRVSAEGLTVEFVGAVKVAGGSAPAANATAVAQALNDLKAAISSAVPAPMDGGATLKSAIMSALSAWPPNVALSELTSD